MLGGSSEINISALGFLALQKVEKHWTSVCEKYLAHIFHTVDSEPNYDRWATEQNSRSRWASLLCSPNLFWAWQPKNFQCPQWKFLKKCHELQASTTRLDTNMYMSKDVIFENVLYFIFSALSYNYARSNLYIDGWTAVAQLEMRRIRIRFPALDTYKAFFSFCFLI